MIPEIASFFFNIGTFLFIFSILNILYIKLAKIGIINLLIANAFLGIGMAYPKKVYDILHDYQAILEFFDSSYTKAFFIALIIYVISFLILYKIFSYFKPPLSLEEQQEINKAKAIKEQKKLEARELNKRHKAQKEQQEKQEKLDQEAIKQRGPQEPSFELEGGSTIKTDNVDASIFAGVRRNDLDSK